jgi:hypothetical protein
MSWAIPPLPQYGFMALVLSLKHRDNFTFTLHLFYIVTHMSERLGVITTEIFWPLKCFTWRILVQDTFRGFDGWTNLYCSFVSSKQWPGRSWTWRTLISGMDKIFSSSPAIHWVWMDLSLIVKRSGHKARHPHQSSADVMNVWSYYLPSPIRHLGIVT